MTFADELYEIAQRVRDTKGGIETEEGTKNALVMPFISKVLGYDVFDPSQVVPEFTADVGTKRGEKIDYAIKQDGVIRLLIECKKVGEPLNLKHASQLFRYFATTEARVAILTNGREYQVFTDGDAPNRMDEKPFLILDLLDIDSTLVPELQKLSKDAFNLDSVINTAEELKYIGMIKRVIASQVREPSDDWLRFFIARVYDGKATQRVLDQFRSLTAKAMNQYIKGQVTERLQNALGDDTEVPTQPVSAGGAAGNTPAAESDGKPDQEASEFVTTDEEVEGFNIVRAIGVEVVGVDRIVLRDAKSYCAILLDDNNRKPVVRLHFNGQTVKYITTFETGKAGVRHDIESTADLYNYTREIRETIKAYIAS